MFVFMEKWTSGNFSIHVLLSQPEDYLSLLFRMLFLCFLLFTLQSSFNIQPNVRYLVVISPFSLTYLKCLLCKYQLPELKEREKRVL